MAKATSYPMPYGDIYSAGTPYLDKLSNQIYADQKQRELMQMKNAQLFNEEYTKNLAQVRPGDVGKLVDAYNTYKQSRINLLKNPNPTPQDQMDLLQKKADIYRVINGSKQKAADEKMIGSLIANDKTGRFRDNAYEIVQNGRSLPYDSTMQVPDANGQPQQIDWTNPDALSRHIDTEGVMKAINFAKGTKPTITSNVEDRYKINPTDLEYQQPTITAYNNPADFFQNMRIPAAKDPRSFLNTIGNPTPEQYQELEDKYNQFMSSPQGQKVKKDWKMTTDLPDDSNLHTDLEKGLKYEAMAYALNPNNQPQVTVKPVKDITAQTKERENFITNKMYSQHRLTQDNIRLAAGLRQGKENDDAVGSADAVLGDMKNIIDAGVPVTGMFGESGKNFVQISDPDILKSYPAIFKDGTTPIPPNKIYFNKNTDQGQLIYEVNEGTADKPIMSEKSIPITGADLVKTKAKSTYTGTNANKVIDILNSVITKKGGLSKTLEMYNQPSQAKPIEINSDKIDPSQLIKGQPYVIKGKNYIWDGERFKLQ